MCRADRGTSKSDEQKGEWDLVIIDVVVVIDRRSSLFAYPLPLDRHCDRCTTRLLLLLAAGLLCRTFL